MSLPKITFGIIVLNGQPFTKYCLRSLYRFAHEIIVVEGASPNATEISTAEGHSLDNTLDVVKAFIKDEDPENKVVLVTAEDEGHANGFWPGEKHEQSRAYATRATGDYLWQVDIDEFYLPDQMQKVLEILETDPTISGMSFKTRTFWGSQDVIVDGPFLMEGAEIYQRLFKWGKDYQYTTHRPPTVVDEQGVNVMDENYIDGNTLYKKHGVSMLHYSLLFPKQVCEKAEYYDRLKPYDYQPLEWFANAYQKLNWPFRYHNVYLQRSWLMQYKGEVPADVFQMILDIKSGEISAELRDETDVRVLLRSLNYRLIRLFWQVAWPYEKGVVRYSLAIKNRLRKLLVKCHLVHGVSP